MKHRRFYSPTFTVTGSRIIEKRSEVMEKKATSFNSQQTGTQPSHKLLPLHKSSMLSHPVGSNSSESLDSPVTSITLQQAHKVASTKEKGMAKSRLKYVKRGRLTL